MAAVSSTDSVVWVMKASLGGRAPQAGDIVDGFDQQHLARRQLAHRALRLGVAGVADHHQLQAVLVVALGLHVHLGHQRAGGIHRQHAAPRRLGRHRLRHAVGREDHRPVVGAVGEVFDEHRPAGAQALDDIAVVHDLVAHVDGRAPALQRHLDDLDRPVHPGAEAARRGEIQRQRGASARRGHSSGSLRRQGFRHRPKANRRGGP
jgi:hypothetical protein